MKQLGIKYCLFRKERRHNEKCYKFLHLWLGPYTKKYILKHGLSPLEHFKSTVVSKNTTLHY